MEEKCQKLRFKDGDHLCSKMVSIVDSLPVKIYT